MEVKLYKVSFSVDSYGSQVSVNINLYEVDTKEDPLILETLQKVKEFYQGEVGVTYRHGPTSMNVDKFSTYVCVCLKTSDTSISQLCLNVWGNEGQSLPLRKKFPTSITNKFLWRYLVRPLFPSGTGTPVTLTKEEHLGSLKDILNRLDEFVEEPYQSGRVFYGGISKGELETPLRALIQSVEGNGKCMVMD